MKPQVNCLRCGRLRYLDRMITVHPEYPRGDLHGTTSTGPTVGYVCAARASCKVARKAARGGPVPTTQDWGKAQERDALARAARSRAAENRRQAAICLSSAIRTPGLRTWARARVAYWVRNAVELENVAVELERLP